MKYTKKIGSLLLTLIVILSLSFNVYAQRIVDSEAGGSHELYIHKIDQTALENYLTEKYGAGAYNGNSSSGEELASEDKVIGIWTLSDGSAAVHNVTIADAVSAHAYLANIKFTITEVELKSEATPGSTVVSDYSDVFEGTTASGTTDADGVLIFTGLTTGYYRVTEDSNSTSSSTVEFIVSLNVSSSVVHAYPKNTTYAGPDIDKEIKDINGNVISWKISSEIPETIQASKGKQEYIITDTLSTGLTVNTSTVKVYYKGTAETGSEVLLINGTDYDFTYDTVANSFKIELLNDGFSKLKAAIDSATAENILYVEYDTVVQLSKADLDEAADPITNEVHLDFTNSDENKYTSDETVTDDKLGGIEITKVDGNDHSILLEGATFKIYTDEACTQALKNTANEDILLTTDGYGKASYYGLELTETYYIKEIAAPQGYKTLTANFPVSVGSASKTVVTIEIENYYDNGLSLPATGGSGTFLFTIAGIGFITAAGIIFFISKKGRKTVDHK